MRFKVKIRHSDQRVPVKFGAVNNISDGGYERGREEGEKIGYENGHKDGETEGYENGYGKGFTDGENSVENYLPYSTTAKFPDVNLFGKSDVTINMPRLSTANEMFRNNVTKALNRTVEHITVNAGTAQPTSMNYMFYQAEPWDADNAFKRITLNVDTSKVEWTNYLVAGLSNLTTIDGTPLDFSSVADATVIVAYACSKLAYIRFAPATIKCNLNMSANPELTAESVRSIVDGYGDMTGQTSPTMTVHADVGARMTEEQKAQLTAKNVTLVY